MRKDMEALQNKNKMLRFTMQNSLFSANIIQVITFSVQAIQLNVTKHLNGAVH
jgi:hypothetical protein